jgi:hypothetical protein
MKNLQRGSPPIEWPALENARIDDLISLKTKSTGGSARQ